MLVALKWWAFCLLMYTVLASLVFRLLFGGSIVGLCLALAGGVDLGYLIKGGLPMKLLCAIVLVFTVAYTTKAYSQDMQYTRDRNGALHVQINPGAGATGPYRNLPSINTPGFTLQGSVGVGAPKLVQDFGSIPVVVPIPAYAPPPQIEAVIVQRRIVLPPNKTEPYLKICRHTYEGTTCREPKNLTRP